MHLNSTYLFCDAQYFDENDDNKMYLLSDKLFSIEFARKHLTMKTDG